MKAIIKVLWCLGAIKVSELLFNLLIRYLNPQELYDTVITKMPFLDSIKILVNNVFSNLNIVIFLSILLLGFDFIDGQVKGLKAPFVIISHSILYIIGFSIIVMLFRETMVDLFTGKTVTILT